MKVSLISYIKDATLRGTLLNLRTSTGLVSAVNTEFFLGHEEPLVLLEEVRQV